MADGLTPQMHDVSRDAAVRYEIVVLSQMLLRWAHLQVAAPPRSCARKVVSVKYTAVFESLLLHCRVMAEFLGVGQKGAYEAKDYLGAPPMAEMKEQYGLGPLYGLLCKDLAHLSTDRKMRSWDVVDDLARPIILAFDAFVEGAAQHADLPELVEARSIALENLDAAVSLLAALPIEHRRHDPWHLPP